MITTGTSVSAGLGRSEYYVGHLPKLSLISSYNNWLLHGPPTSVTSRATHLSSYFCGGVSFYTIQLPQSLSARLLNMSFQDAKSTSSSRSLILSRHDGVGDSFSVAAIVPFGAPATRDTNVMSIQCTSSSSGDPILIHWSTSVISSPRHQVLLSVWGDKLKDSLKLLWSACREKGGLCSFLYDALMGRLKRYHVSLEEK